MAPRGALPPDVSVQGLIVTQNTSEARWRSPLIPDLPTGPSSAASPGDPRPPAPRHERIIACAESGGCGAHCIHWYDQRFAGVRRRRPRRPICEGAAWSSPKNRRFGAVSCRRLVQRMESTRESARRLLRREAGRTQGPGGDPSAAPRRRERGAVRRGGGPIRSCVRAGPQRGRAVPGPVRGVRRLVAP